MKKLLSCLLSVLMLISVVPLGFTVGAAQYTEGYYIYTVSGDEATIVGVDSNIGVNIVIPKLLGGYTVTGIGWSAFHGDGFLESVVLPETLETIGVDAFRGCFNLKSIYIPANVYYIGSDAFNRCATQYGSDCDSSFKEINVDSENEYYSSIDGVLFDKNKNTLICYPMAKEGSSYFVPESVTRIEDKAFFSCMNICDITIGNKLEIIGNSAFQFCEKLEKVQFTDTLRVIGDEAFRSSGLRKVEINAGVERIGYCAFVSCKNLTDILVSNNNFYSSENGTLYNKNKTEIICCPAGKEDTSYEIISTVRRIEDYAFADCIIQLKNCEIPEGVAEIGEGAFLGCNNMEIITVPESAINIGEEAFGRTFYLSGDHDYYARIILKGYAGSAVETYVKENSDYSKIVFIPHGHTHTDENKDNLCEGCNVYFPQICPSCNCHKSGFLGFIWKLQRFFWKIFRINSTCSCGIAHY